MTYEWITDISNAMEFRAIGMTYSMYKHIKNLYHVLDFCINADIKLDLPIENRKTELILACEDILKYAPMVGTNRDFDACGEYSRRYLGAIKEFYSLYLMKQSVND